ncbi:hypothetical protein JCM5350_006847 [Sporobolomyces pararoseus]
MSTTSPQPPSAKTEGECVVCGKICSTRCSSCAQNGLDWMYFCSTEHQRLIWFAHKRICGVNSNPFQWPLLDEEERADCWKFKDVEYENSHGEVVTLEKACDGRGFPFEEMMTMAARTQTSLSRQLSLRMLHNFTFFQLRAQVRKELSTSPSPELRQIETKARMAQHPYGYLSNYLERSWPNLRSYEPRNYEWYSDLHHRLAILFALICQNDQNPEDYLAHMNLVKYSLEKIIKLMEGRVSKDQPEGAQEFETNVKSSGVKVWENVQTGKTIGFVNMRHL